MIEDERARNSDSFLYLRVLEHYAKRFDIRLENVSIADYLTNMASNIFPPFETVRRARQKLQRAFPELAACEKVEAMRCVNEREFREYARGIVE